MNIITEFFKGLRYGLFIAFGLGIFLVFKFKENLEDHRNRSNQQSDHQNTYFYSGYVALIILTTSAVGMNIISWIGFIWLLFYGITF